MELAQLPPGVWTETFTHVNGKEVAVYRAPFASEGPLLVAEDDQKILYFMYAFYVFRWPKGATHLDIGHGTIRHHMGLRIGIPITGPWDPEALTSFAVGWARTQFNLSRNA